MKTLKVFAISLMILSVVLLSVAVGSASAEGIRAVVVGTEKVGAEYRVDCLTADGNVWSFFDTEDYWQEGDKLTLTFEGEMIVFAE